MYPFRAGVSQSHNALEGTAIIVLVLMRHENEIEMRSCIKNAQPVLKRSTTFGWMQIGTACVMHID